MDNLGIDDKIIENLNIFKIWQLEVATWQLVLKVHFLEGDSRECLGGDEWWEMATVGSRRTKVRILLSYPFEKTFWVVDAMIHLCL